MATTQQTLTDVEPSLVDQYVTEDGSTIETREADDGTVEEQCPSCGNWYQRIAQHWSAQYSQYPPISQRKWQMFKGLMMGDGTLINKDQYKNCRFCVGNTNITFLKYLQDEFGWLARCITDGTTSQDSADNLNGLYEDTEYGSGYVKAEDCYDTQLLWMGSHPILNKLKRWLKTGEKVFPRLEYTKPLLRMWYVSDGSFNWRNGHSRVTFASRNEGERPENIIKSFSDIGFDCYVSDERTFCISQAQTEEFFDYIGHDAVPGFEYKWAWKNRERYDYLKKARDHVHRTQTIE